MSPGDDSTVLYLVRHGATAANLERPARIQGRSINPSLAPLGIRQAEATRDLLQSYCIRHCYCSPLIRAVETARIIASLHGIHPTTIPGLTECDVGRWEGIPWEVVEKEEPDAFRRFHDNPAEFGYPGGESFAQVHDRVRPIFEELLTRHCGESFLVVAHHVVNRTYLAGLLGLGPHLARRVILDNCGVSIVRREGKKSAVITINAALHLHGLE